MIDTEPAEIELPDGTVMTIQVKKGLSDEEFARIAPGIVRAQMAIRSQPPGQVPGPRNATLAAGTTGSLQPVTSADSMGGALRNILAQAGESIGGTGTYGGTAKGLLKTFANLAMMQAGGGSQDTLPPSGQIEPLGDLKDIARSTVGNVVEGVKAGDPYQITEGVGNALPYEPLVAGGVLSAKDAAMRRINPVALQIRANANRIPKSTAQHGLGPSDVAATMAGSAIGAISGAANPFIGPAIAEGLNMTGRALRQPFRNALAFAQEKLAKHLTRNDVAPPATATPLGNAPLAVNPQTSAPAGVSTLPIRRENVPPPNAERSPFSQTLPNFQSQAIAGEVRPQSRYNPEDTAAAIAANAPEPFQQKPLPGPRQDIPMANPPETTSSPLPKSIAEPLIEQKIAPSGAERQALTQKIAPTLAQDAELVKIAAVPEWDAAVWKRFQAAKAGLDAVDDVVPAETTLPKKPLKDAIRTAIEKLKVPGKTAEKTVPVFTEGKGITGFETKTITESLSGHPDAVAILEKAFDEVNKFPDDIPYSDLKKFREQLDDAIATHSGWKKEASAADQAAMRAKRVVANAVRKSLSINDAVKAANEAYGLAADTMNAAGLNWKTGRRLATTGDVPKIKPAIKAAPVKRIPGGPL